MNRSKTLPRAAEERIDRSLTARSNRNAEQPVRPERRPSRVLQEPDAAQRILQTALVVNSPCTTLGLRDRDHISRVSIRMAILIANCGHHRCAAPLSITTLLESVQSKLTVQHHWQLDL
jgi:hypothetical protein